MVASAAPLKAITFAAEVATGRVDITRLARVRQRGDGHQQG